MYENYADFILHIDVDVMFKLDIQDSENIDIQIKILAMWQILDHIFKSHNLFREPERFSHFDIDFMINYLKENPDRKWELYIMAAFNIVRKLPESKQVNRNVEVLGIKRNVFLFEDIFGKIIY